jgi:CRP-like cAMP-binding protein
MMMPISTLQNVKPQTFRAPRAVPSEAPHQSTDVALKRASAASRSGPQRLAALLSGISRNNSYEGRDPLLIPDSLTSGFVAELLGARVSDLAEWLLELEHQGLVTQGEAGGLRLTNVRALDGLSDLD